MAAAPVSSSEKAYRAVKTTFQTINLTGSNRSRTLLLVLLLRLLNSHISLPFSNFSSLHWLKVNERIEYKLLSLTYKLLTTSQPSYLNNLISVQPPRSTRSSSIVTLFRPPTISSLKITYRSHSDMHHPVSGINSLILSVSLASHVSTHLLIHLSAHLCHHHTLIIHHSFTLSLQSQNLPFQQILPTLDFFYLPDCLHYNWTGPDLSYSSFYF